MLNYARSGGTLLNKCLASLPNVVMLSEVNPLGCGSGSNQENPTNSIKSQAKEWYNIDVYSESFKDQINEIYNFCIQNNKTLVIRDWSIVNFHPWDSFNNANPPKNFLLIEELKNDYDLKIFGFVRDAIDVWISRGCKNIDNFFEGYSPFVYAMKNLNCPVFKYEKFTENPRQQLKLICDTVGLEYKDVTNDCMYFKNVNGDVQLGNKSRGIEQSKIKPLPRKKIPSEKIADINNCNEMKEANHIFNYPTTYYNNFIKDNYMVPGKNLIKKILR